METVPVLKINKQLSFQFFLKLGIQIILLFVFFAEQISPAKESLSQILDAHDGMTLTYRMFHQGVFGDTLCEISQILGVE